MLSAFGEFADLIPNDGVLIACHDNPAAKELGKSQIQKGKSVMTYGLSDDALWRAVDTQPNNAGGSDYVALRGNETVGLVRLRVPGLHNVVNSLAALAVSERLGISFSQTQDSLAAFRGVLRRFEIKGETSGVTVVDDYGHHPSEIKATLAAARTRFPGRKIWAVFQPHTYSRVKALLDDFAGAFMDADHVIVTAIYAARERDTLGVSSTDIVARMNGRHPDVRHIAGLDDATAFLLDNVGPGNVVVTLSAGDGNRVGEKLLEELGRTQINEKAGEP
jgi:UDP-N-acetylmuramate--alanine ligase